MINQLINQHRIGIQQNGSQNNDFTRKQTNKQQPVKIFQKDEFFLIAVINLILTTVRLTIFNVIFLLTFITSCLKFYKTYLMEKHVDEIEIAPLEMGSKNRSIFIHYLAKFISDILTQKDLKKNVVLCVFVILGYIIFRFIALNWILMIILDFQYLYCLKRRWSQNKQTSRKRQVLENLMSPTKIKTPPSLISTRSSNKPSYYPPQYPYQNLKPIGESFGEINMQKSIQSNASQNVISQNDIAMSMIEEQQQSQKLQFDQQLPESSSEKIKIIGHRNSLKQIENIEQKLIKNKNEKSPNKVQYKQSLIEIYEDDSQSIEGENQIQEKKKSVKKVTEIKKKKL